jgi:hypothetical protein
MAKIVELESRSGTECGTCMYDQRGRQASEEIRISYFGKVEFGASTRRLSGVELGGPCDSHVVGWGGVENNCVQQSNRMHANIHFFIFYTLCSSLPRRYVAVTISVFSVPY